MTTRSVTNRHFTGGFVGGVLGILTGYFIALIALPIGCFIGVVLGFWYQELGSAIATEWRKFQNERAMLVEPAMHPFDVARLIQGWAITLGWITLMVTFLCVAIFLDNQNGGLLLLGGFIFGGMMSWFLWESSSSTDGPEGMHNYYLLLATYENMGGSWLFVREFVGVLLLPLVAVAFVIMILAGVIFFAIFIMFPIGATVLFILFIYATVRQIYKIAAGPGHWLCVGVTIAVTGATAYAMGDNMTSMNVWLVALVAGTLSGGTSVYAHRYLKWALERSPRIEAVLDKTADQRFGELIDVINRARLWLFSPIGYQYRMRPAHN